MTTSLFDNSYIRLSPDFYQNCNPEGVKKPALISFNQELAKQLGIEGLALATRADVLSGNTLLAGSQPLAMAYAGHQFGHFSKQLGDGRAVLLGEVIGTDKTRYFIQLKGSGKTPFSRGGDGRSALGPVLREYLLSETMHHLGIPTTRALGAVTTGEQVARDQLVAGGILTRVSKGFVRVGTFEYFLARRDFDAIKELADYEIEQHYPRAAVADNPYLALFTEIVDRQAKLIASWMNVGFIHGVMNTDNMSIVGETIDYGPCAFIDLFNHQVVFSSIDRDSRYAYLCQPQMGKWNLTRLIEALFPLFRQHFGDAKEEKEVVAIATTLLDRYTTLYDKYWLAGMQRKLGLLESYPDDKKLAHEFVELMHHYRADFTLAFFYLSQKDKRDQLLALFDQPDKVEIWLKTWDYRRTLEVASENESNALMRSVNPVYIPRNHQVEAAIRAAEDHQDFSVFHDLLDVLKTPYTLQQGKQAYQLPPKPEEIVRYTFCGT